MYKLRLIKSIGLLVCAGFLAFSIASCEQEKSSKTTTPTTQEDDKKVKINIDADDNKLEVESDKVDIGLDGEDNKKEE